MSRARLIFSTALIALLAACGDDTEPREHEPDGSADSGAEPDGGDLRPTLTIRFDARAGDVPARCGDLLPGFGPEGDRAASLADLRFYVHAIELRDPDGDFVPATIVDEAPWQADGVALLDFEDASADCSNGTAPTRDHVAVHVPEGEYDAIRFTLGVPFELNHRDVTTSPSPLNLTRLYWTWRGGYIFFRVDLESEDGRDFHVHLGSTGCVSEAPTLPPDEACARPNRPTFTLEGFDADASVVVLDLTALLSGVDLDFNTEGTGLGCQAAPTDPECVVPMTALGLSFGEAEPTWSAFRLSND